MENSEHIFIRALNPDDWEILRAIRTRAVTMHPSYFMASAEEAQNYLPETWKETLDGHGKQVFGLFDGKTLIGVTAVFTKRDDPSGLTGNMAYSFIEPAYRRRGLTDLFYKARIDWALAHTHWTTLVTAHRAGNEPSRRAILRNGFTLAETKMTTWPSGGGDLEYCYTLDLKALRVKP